VSWSTVASISAAAYSNDPTTVLLTPGFSNSAYFEHIMMALVRQLKIPCRYVSGYLYYED